MYANLMSLCISSSTKTHRFTTHNILVYKLSGIKSNIRNLDIFAIFTIKKYNYYT
jgi:hypothetical protein